MENNNNYLMSKFKLRLTEALQYAEQRPIPTKEQKAATKKALSAGITNRMHRIVVMVYHEALAKYSQIK